MLAGIRRRRATTLGRDFARLFTAEKIDRRQRRFPITRKPAPTGKSDPDRAVKPLARSEGADPSQIVVGIVGRRRKRRSSAASAVGAALKLPLN
jgi:hypothetical protein